MTNSRAWTIFGGLQFSIGFALIVVGAYQLDPRAAFIVAGVGLCIGGRNIVSSIPPAIKEASATED